MIQLVSLRNANTYSDNSELLLVNNVLLRYSTLYSQLYNIVILYRYSK